MKTLFRRLIKSCIVFLFSGICFFSYSQEDTIHYRVQKAEGFYTLKRKFGVSEEQLRQYNPALGEGLKLGQLLVVPVVAQTDAQDKTEDSRVLHVVQKGETLYSISLQHQVTQENIRQANPGLTNSLRIGEEIVIPLAEQEQEQEPMDENYHYHKVEAKETVYGLCRKYDISQNTFLNANPGVVTAGLKAGVTVRIPKQEDLSKTSPSMGKGGNLTPEDEVFNQNIEIFKHTVRKGETLYGLAKYYRVSQVDIKKLNEGLKGTALREGETLNIPINDLNRHLITAKKDYYYYKVPKKIKLKKLAPVFGLSVESVKKYNPTIRRQLKENQLIRIPLGSAVDNEALKDEKQRGEPGATEGAIEEETEFGMSTIFKRKKKPLDVIDIALLLPFDIPEEDETESVKTNKTSELFIEFYAGAKLAAMQLMEAGVDIRLHCFDTPKGLDEMAKILDKPEMRDMHLIVGPAYISQLPMLADFAKRNKIMTVLPFKVRDRAIYSNPYLIELNDNHDFWSEEANFTIDSWMNSGAIYVLDQDKIVDSKKRTLDYALLENKVRLHNEKFPETRVSLERVNIADLQLNKGQANKKAIFIIPSLSQAVVSSVIPQLHIKVKRSGLNAMLVGCPEWQAFSSLDLDMLHDLNLSFYTPLYVDYTADRTSVFLEQFRESFFTEPDAGYPYFGVYGYDIIQFFGNALSEHGKYFQEFLENCAYPQIGAQFRFRRPELWSGFVNTGFFHIRYTPDYEVEIIEEDFPVQMGR